VTLTRLHGVRVLITRPTGDGDGEWKTALENEGASVISYPTLEIAPPNTWEGVDQAITDIRAYGWIIFTSQTAVRSFASRCSGGRLPSGPRIAAVGLKTAAVVERHGRTCDVVATDSRQEGLLDVLAGKLLNQAVLLPKAAVTRPLLAQTLRASGCRVDELVVYQNLVPNLLPVDPTFDVVVVGSPSALRGFLLKNDVGLLAGKVMVVIGPTSAAFARSFGLRPVIADRPDIHSVIEKMVLVRS